MAEIKTKKTGASAAEFLAGIKDEDKRRDCQALAKLMTRVTGAKPKMWGPSIVGFGDSQVVYASGKLMDWFPIGFSPRARNLALYGTAPKKQAALLKKLGKHKLGGGCLYVDRLEDVDLAVLEKLLRTAVAAKK
jgi:hypothetical protein